MSCFLWPQSPPWGGGWQQIEIETTTWPWPRAIVIVTGIIFGPVLFFCAAIWLGTHGGAAAAAEAIPVMGLIPASFGIIDFNQY